MAQRICAEEGLRLDIKPQGPQLELRWLSKLRLPLSTSTARYEIQRSDDLVRWQTVGSPILGRMGVSDEILRASFTNDQLQGFYRLAGSVEAGTAQASGAEVFGYGSAMAQELARLGLISPAEFAAMYPAPVDYLPQLSFDPTTAQYWQDWQTDHSRPGLQLDFRLNAAELAVFKQYGFVVSERLGSRSFAGLFYRIYSADLPVFVSADAILQAWHFSYLEMLKELEQTYLFSQMEQILNGVAGQVPAYWKDFGTGVLKDSILDADYFVTVARRLLTGQPLPSALGQDERVSKTMTAIQNEQLFFAFDLFGAARDVDFSQFKVRGHYTTTEKMKRYFQCLMWLGRTDLRLAGVSQLVRPQARRELGTAIVLLHLLQQAGQFDNWARFDRCLQTFVGCADSMTFSQLNELLGAAKIQRPGDIATLAVLDQFQRAIEQGDVGVQEIRGDVFFSPFGPEQVKLPVSFTFAGQKFVLDSWVLAKVVFDDVIWDEDGIRTFDDKVARRIPSGLDVAFAVLGNDQVVPEIVARINNRTGRRFRDGLFYQHNLAAARNVIDRQAQSAWTNNIYVHWLAALRELSAPTTDACYPECLRTRAWAMKTLNTQLASWTQLRHDTILYAKQSYTAGTVCSYPEGYVEPRLGFWRRMAAMTRGTAELIQASPYAGVCQIDYEPPFAFSRTIELATVKTNQTSFLQRFAATMDQLAGIAEKEVAHQPLAGTETQFLKELIEYNVGSGVRRYTGWYPALFYKNVLQPIDFDMGAGADKWDALVADVHTDLMSEIHGDPGCILHEAVGNVHFLMVAIDCDGDRMIYGGPVLSHYEFEMPLDQRKTDSEWQSELSQGKHPPQPDWTQAYLVPGELK